MNRRTLMSTLATFGFVVVVLATNTSHAFSPATRKAWFQFAETVELPNATLPAGEYAFEVWGFPFQHRSLVKITTRKGGRPRFSGVAFLVERPRRLPTDPVIVFDRVRPNAPPRLREFFLPGGVEGYRFDY